MSVLTHDRSLTPELVRKRLSIHEEIVHSTIELHYSPDGSSETRSDRSA